MSQGHGDPDRCEAIVNSISALASGMELHISELEQSGLEFADPNKPLLVLGKLVSLQQRVQRMRGRLLEFGCRLPAHQESRRRDSSVPSQIVGEELLGDTLCVKDQASDPRFSIPCRRVALLTFGGWTTEATEVLSQSGLLKGRGDFGLFYLVHLAQFQKEYLENIRHPCGYHVITEVHCASEVAALIDSLPCAKRGRLRSQQVLDLPVNSSEQMCEEPVAPRHASSSRDPSASTNFCESVAGVSGIALQLGHHGDVSLYQAGVFDTQRCAKRECDQSAPNSVED